MRVLFARVLPLLAMLASKSALVQGSTTKMDEASDEELWDLLSTPEIRENLHRTFAFPLDAEDDSLRRQLQTPPDCGEILRTYNLEETKTLLSSFFDINNPGDTTTKLILLSLARYGVSVRKLCGACSDFAFESLTYGSTIGCSPDDYGYNVTHSGLAFVPMTADGSSVLPGTNVLTIYAHGTRSSRQPSTDWSDESTNPETFSQLLIPVITGSPIVLPDYMGYGESLGAAFRAYLIKKAYQTATMPLIFRLEEMIADETDCQAAVADAAVVMGYSEGGYAAVAIAEALAAMEKDIIRVQAGGGPYALSSAQLLRAQARLDDGSFPEANNFYLALFGSAYSSTYEDISTCCSTGNDVLRQESRGVLVNLVNSGASSQDLNTAIKDLVSSGNGNPSEVMRSDLVAFTQAANSAGDSDPCSASSTIPNRPDAICQALQSQDLVEGLLSVAYRVNFCHSPDDVLVDYANVPDVSQNSQLTLYTSSGSHEDAGVDCLTQNLFFFQSADFTGYSKADKHLTSCALNSLPTPAPVPGVLPTSSPTAAPFSVGTTLSPTPTGDTSPPTVVSATPGPTGPASTTMPTSSPTFVPTTAPSTTNPTSIPTLIPTFGPTAMPSTFMPTGSPTIFPTLSNSTNTNTTTTSTTTGVGSAFSTGGRVTSSANRIGMTRLNCKWIFGAAFFCAFPRLFL